jgi:hypothetical protein
MAVPKAPKTTVGKKRDSKGQLRDYDKENAYRKRNQKANTQRTRDKRALLKAKGLKRVPEGMEVDHTTKGDKKFNGKNSKGVRLVSKTANRKKQPANKGRTKRA